MSVEHIVLDTAIGATPPQMRAPDLMFHDNGCRPEVDWLAAIQEIRGICEGVEVYSRDVFGMEEPVPPVLPFAVGAAVKDYLESIVGEPTLVAAYEGEEIEVPRLPDRRARKVNDELSILQYAVRELIDGNNRDVFADLVLHRLELEGGGGPVSGVGYLIRTTARLSLLGQLKKEKRVELDEEKKLSLYRGMEDIRVSYRAVNFTDKVPFSTDDVEAAVQAFIREQMLPSEIRQFLLDFWDDDETYDLPAGCEVTVTETQLKLARQVLFLINTAVTNLAGGHPEDFTEVIDWLILIHPESSIPQTISEELADTESFLQRKTEFTTFQTMWEFFRSSGQQVETQRRLLEKMQRNLSQHEAVMPEGIARTLARLDEVCLRIRLLKSIEFAPPEVIQESAARFKEFRLRRMLEDLGMSVQYRMALLHLAIEQQDDEELKLNFRKNLSYLAVARDIMNSGGGRNQIVNIGGVLKRLGIVPKPTEMGREENIALVEEYQMTRILEGLGVSVPRRVALLESVLTQEEQNPLRARMQVELARLDEAMAQSVEPDSSRKEIHALLEGLSIPPDHRDQIIKGDLGLLAKVREVYYASHTDVSLVRTAIAHFLGTCDVSGGNKGRLTFTYHPIRDRRTISFMRRCHVAEDAVYEWCNNGLPLRLTERVLTPLIEEFERRAELVEDQAVARNLNRLAQTFRELAARLTYLHFDKTGLKVTDLSVDGLLSRLFVNSSSSLGRKPRYRRLSLGN
jgi:hypothetical protein